MKEKEKFMLTKRFSGSVERNRAASQTCQRLFPQWSKPPTQGELQKIIIESWKEGAGESEIKAAGNWWLWIRKLIIENTITKQAKHKIMNMAVSTALNQQPIHFVTARSPELLHAQVENQGSKSLPRSKAAIRRTAELSFSSREFLPTQSTILFADLAIDNLEKIQEACGNIEKAISDNLERLQEICQDAGLKDFQILRMSQLGHPQGKLGEVLDLNGNPQIPIHLSPQAERMIEIASRESLESHKRMFCWNEEESKVHNRKLALTMGLVGQAIQLLEPPPIIIHNEAFIARGALNNLFTPPENPVPVICLKDLLERKRHKG